MYRACHKLSKVKPAQFLLLSVVLILVVNLIMGGSPTIHLHVNNAFSKGSCYNSEIRSTGKQSIKATKQPHRTTLSYLPSGPPSQVRPPEIRGLTKILQNSNYVSWAVAAAVAARSWRLSGLASLKFMAAALHPVLLCCYTCCRRHFFSWRAQSVRLRTSAVRSQIIYKRSLMGTFPLTLA